MSIIYITGKPGTGKSTVAGFFRQHSYNIIDADRIGHSLLDSSSIRQQLIKAFGAAILNKQKKVARKALAKAAFASRKKLEKLNRIMHPHIRRKIHEKLRTHGKIHGKPRARHVIDAALYHAFRPKQKHTIILVKADDSAIRKRMKGKRAKDKNHKSLLRRAKFHKAIRKAHYVIHNNGTKAELKAKVGKILKRMS